LSVNPSFFYTATFDKTVGPFFWHRGSLIFPLPKDRFLLSVLILHNPPNTSVQKCTE